MSRRVAAVVAVPLIVAAVGFGASFVESGQPPAPADVLVVQANLQEALRSPDVRDQRDVDNFVAALARRVPGTPDAVLLAEVLGPGARRVATRMSATFGEPYRVVVEPGGEVFSPDGSVRETAIVVNSRTLSVERDGSGFRRVQSEDQAYATVRQAGSDRRLRLVAGHVGGDPAVAAEAFHELGQDGGATPVLGVDLRLPRCVLATDDQPVDCAPQPFWTTLTEGHAYTDAAYERGLEQYLPHGGYLLTPGAVTSARVDSGSPAGCKEAFDSGRSGSAPGECRTGYYADSPFTWAKVGEPEPVRRAVLPREVTLDHCEFGTRVAAIVARVANRTDAEVAEQVTATAPEPVVVEPAEATVTAPAGEARQVTLRVTAPQQAPPGRHGVTVHIGESRTVVPVVVPEGACTEPEVYASSFNAGHPPENAIDGDIATFWHTEWSPPAPLPQSITLNLGEVKAVSTVNYQPRFDGNLNGTILDHAVYVSEDGREYTEVARGTWVTDARMKTATFPVTQARYVKLEALSAVGGSFASVAEVTVG